MLTGEIVTVVEHRAGRRGAAKTRNPYRAIVLAAHLDDRRRVVVGIIGTDVRRTVWREEIEQDDQPTFANYPRRGLPLV